MSMRTVKPKVLLYWLTVLASVCLLLSSCRITQKLMNTETEPISVSSFGNDLNDDYYYDLTGLYKNIDGTLQQVYAGPVLQMCFYRVGAGSSGPVVLTYDPENPVYSADGNLCGDSIVELLSERSFAEASIPDELKREEFVWLDHASHYGLWINSLQTVDGAITFSRKIAAQDGYNSYTYWVSGDGVLCMSYEAANPKDDPYYSILHPNIYKDKRVQEEIERLDALGIGLSSKTSEGRD